MRARRPARGQAPGPWLAGEVIRGEDYDRHFASLAASGADVHGEAAFVESLGVHRVLDAGCGTGRVAIELAHRGCSTVGVDLDPSMLDEARSKAPELDWRLEDLGHVRLGRGVDAVVLAGNVMLFLAPGSGPGVLANLASHLEGPGLFVAGFSLRRGLELKDYDAWAAAASLVLVERFATWQRESFGAGGDYAVSLHRLESPRPVGTVGP